ncbi:MAG: metal transporter ATP-binding protein [Oerskovia sp.]|nr:metal transporter ATP-binding protein [Oerskovia sp.]
MSTSPLMSPDLPGASSVEPPAIEARGVHVRLGSSDILRGVDLTVGRGEVVASGLLHGRRIRLPRGWRATAREALDRVGLADRAQSAVHELSGGQQQRVLIARALARSPELLILDEPVAGVDQPSQEAFAATLTELTRGGMTVLVVLHELGALAPLIQRCVVLRHGLVVHDGEPPHATAAHAGPDHEHLHPHGDDAERGTSAGIDMGLIDAPLTHHTPTPTRIDRGAAS